MHIYEEFTLLIYYLWDPAGLSWKITKCANALKCLLNKNTEIICHWFSSQRKTIADVMANQMKHI